MNMNTTTLYPLLPVKPELIVIISTVRTIIDFSLSLDLFIYFQTCYGAYFISYSSTVLGNVSFSMYLNDTKRPLIETLTRCVDQKQASNGTSPSTPLR